ncbi:MAG: ATP-dependent metallopeptidase FtsH/Yme1/Tma family protein, partial [Syntrophomonas sp.]|nr:ATP-dependent metallopeptidase FtsH/Yme1/Tma family protein [Syntrophomonas sp.]
MDRALKNIAIYVLIVLLALFAVKLTSTQQTQPQELNYTQFYTHVQGGQVASARAEVDDLVYNITATMKNGAVVSVTAPKESDIIQVMQANGVILDTPPVPPPKWWIGLLTTLFPILILIVVLIFIMNQTQGGGNKVM